MKTHFTDTINACIKAGMTAEDINAVVDNRIALSYAIDEAKEFYESHSDDLEWYIGELEKEFKTYENPIWFKYGL